MRRFVACFLAFGLLFAVFTVEAQAALSIKRARLAAYNLAKKVGEQDGASYVFAGYCKRKTANRVNCWGALIYDDGTAAAQRISVVKGERVKARRFGGVVSGSLTEGGDSGGGANDEWAVCSPNGFCVGS